MDAWIKVKDSNTNMSDEILYIESNDRKLKNIIYQQCSKCTNIKNKFFNK